MSDSVLPAEGEPIGAVHSGWLQAARWSALTCAITLGAGYAAEGGAAHDFKAALVLFGRWGALSLALVYLLYRRGKNALGFALGLSAATGLIALLALASSAFAHLSELLRHLLFILAIFAGILPPFSGMMEGDSRQLAALGAVLLVIFSAASAMLAISSIAAFQKMAPEPAGTGKPRFAFWAGIFCAPAVWVLFMLIWLVTIGGFGM